MQDLDRRKRRDAYAFLGGRGVHRVFLVFIADEWVVVEKY